MGVTKPASTKRNYVVALARNGEHAEAVAIDLVRKGIPAARLEIPADFDLCALCRPARKAQKLAFVMGALVATVVGIVLLAVVVIVRQLF
jgi:hypothetical protein